MNPDEYKVDYNDSRLTSIKDAQDKDVQNITNQYNEMANNSDKFYQSQIDASKQYAEQQKQTQQANTDFAIEKINQEKEEAQKDYTKEQKGSYSDYQKQINSYGVNAENMASNGLTNTGYSESSKVSMYNTYQNRVATARDSLNKSLLNFSNSIKEAQLANSTTLADIAYKAFQTQLEVSLQGFQYKNSLLEAKQNQINTTNNRYDTSYQNMLSQINSELERKKTIDEANRQYDLTVKQINEGIRQFIEEMNFKKQQQEDSKRQWQAQHDLDVKQTEANLRKIEAEIQATKNSMVVQETKNDTEATDNTTKSNTTNRINNAQDLLRLATISKNTNKNKASTYAYGTNRYGL